MTFKSKKDWLFSLIFLGFSVFVIGVVCYRIYLGDLKSHDYWGLLIPLLVVGLLLWFFFGTNYELNNDEFIYRNGPISGKINIKRIVEVEKGKTLWVGYRPATARGGLIVKYDRFNEIYISPETNEIFIDCLLKIKSDVKVIG
jgi:amino acid transporter